MSKFLIMRNNYKMKSEHHDKLILNSHGKVIGSPFITCLKDIEFFLNKNKNEFIIIKIRSGKSVILNFIKNILLNYLCDILGEKMITQKDRSEWFGIDSVTMGQIRDHNKNLLVLFDEEFFEDLKLESNSELTLLETQNILKEKGIFIRNKFSKECNYYKDNSMDLIHKMEESLNEIDKKRFRTSYYIFPAKKKFKINYLLNLPTVYKMEKEQFLKKNKIMSHLIECIHNSQDINIGNY